MPTPSLSLHSVLLKRLFAGLLAALLFTTQAQAWWNSEWMIRKKITVDVSAGGISEDVGTAAAILIRLHDGDFQFGEAKDGGADVRFVSEDDKTLLPYHIEKFDSLMNEMFVWVKVPGVKAGAKVNFWLYYGNASDKTAKADDSKGTYDADTVLVYHFSEKNTPANDFTMTGNGAQNVGLPVEGSLIGGGIRFDGKGAVTIPGGSSLTWAEDAPMTWSLWVKPGAPEPNQAIFTRRDGANAFVIGSENGVPYVSVTKGGTAQKTTGGAPMTNAWTHLAVVADAAKITLYVNGDSYATLNAGLPALSTPAALGGEASPAAGEAAPASPDGSTAFNGEVDELQISKVARPVGFVKLQATEQAGGDKAAKVLGMAADERQSNWLSWLMSGTAGILIKSLTLDGWVVIGLLTVMAGISWFVMISKGSYLNAIARGNKLFLQEWEHVVNDLTVLDNADDEKIKTLGGRIDAVKRRAMRNSSVYRIYHIGAVEIRKRVSKGNRFLTVRSIQAIRASLDGGMVIETQNLNSQLVLLTIAISGGPFLGLLGTVVGVMITFAAIAAAGDVNVNAIAPGIAAALVATVAGLAVAIPSLFGYNYLLARVKDATTNMHVFIDEFVTKMAEYYGDENVPPDSGVSGALPIEYSNGNGNGNGETKRQTDPNVRRGSEPKAN